MPSSEEEDIFKRQRRFTGRDDLDTLFEQKPEYSESESEDYNEQALDLQDVFGTGNEYDFVYQEKFLENEPVEKDEIKKQHDFSYLDKEDLNSIFNKYIILNDIRDNEIVSYFLRGLNINFIALHRVSSNETPTFSQLLRIKNILDEFPSYYTSRKSVMEQEEKRKRTRKEQGTNIETRLDSNSKNISNENSNKISIKSTRTCDLDVVANIKSFRGLKQYLIYQQHIEEYVPVLISCDQFAENIHLNENLHVNRNIVDENIHLNENLHVNRNIVDENIYREIIDAFLRGEPTRNRDAVHGFIIKMSNHPFLIEFCNKYSDMSYIRRTLFKLLANIDCEEKSERCYFYEMVLEKIVSLAGPKNQQFLVNPESKYFTKTVDFILNTAVEQPTEKDYYMSVTEVESTILCLISDYCGNQIANFCFLSKDFLSLEGTIIEYSPTIIFCTGDNKNFKFFYMKMNELVDNLNLNGISHRNDEIKCMLIDPIIEPTQENLSLINNEKFEVKQNPFSRLPKIELIRIYNLLLHIARRAIFPEIELMHVISKSIIPLFCSDNLQSLTNSQSLTKLQILSIIKTAISFSISITGLDINYFLKCERMRSIVPTFIEYFNKNTLNMISDIGFISNLETIKDSVLDFTFEQTQYNSSTFKQIQYNSSTFEQTQYNSSTEDALKKEIFKRLSNHCKTQDEIKENSLTENSLKEDALKKEITKKEISHCKDKVDDEILYYNLTTYLRLKPEIYNIKDAQSALDPLLTHPMNYYKTKMICAASENKKEVPQGDSINKIIRKCFNDKTFINRLNLEEGRKKEVISHCVNLCYKRTIFEGLDDENVFEMFNRGYILGKVYEGIVLKVTEELIIVLSKDNSINKEYNVVVRKSTLYNPQQEYFPNDQVKVKITEPNILGLSFRGEIISQKAFFLQSHPLFQECTSTQAEIILRTKKEVLLLRKSSTGEQGAIVFNVNDDIFIHYRIRPYNGKILFNDRLFDDVDQIIWGVFRITVKHQSIIESDKNITIKYLKSQPGRFEASRNDKNVIVGLGQQLIVGGKGFHNWDELKYACGLD